jgi:Flp pilus assembly protein TadG
MRRRGAAAVEFALCLPPIVLIVGAIIDLSSFLTLQQVVSRAARDGARVGSTVIEGATATGVEIEADAMAQADLLLTEAGLPCDADCSITAEWVDVDGVMYVRVAISYPYDPFVGLSTFLSDSVNVQFTMMTQQQ